MQWLDAVYNALDSLVDEYGGTVTKVETVRAPSLYTLFSECY